MISIHARKSYVIIDAARVALNQGKPLKERMRDTHKSMLKALVWLLQKEIRRIQKFGGKGHRDRVLHRVRTNRKNLAKLADCGEKTVYNRLERLVSLGCIRKIWHGDKASFEVEINPDLIHVQDDELNAPVNVSNRFDSALPHMRQFLPHTPPRVPWDTNELNKEKGLPADDATAASPAAAPDADNPKRPDTDSGYHPSNDAPPVPASQKGDTEVPGAAGPRKKPLVADRPEALPRTFSDVAQLVAPKHRVWLQQRVDHVYEYALSELYQWFPAWIAASVREKGRIALAEYFAYSTPRCWKAAAIEFCDRIDLVCNYLERRQQNGDEAWLPLPHVWFDCRRDNAFAATKTWLKENKATTKPDWQKAAVQKELVYYWRALESKRIDADLALFQIKQRLDKKGADLFDLFVQQFKTAAVARGAA